MNIIHNILYYLNVINHFKELVDRWLFFYIIKKAIVYTYEYRYDSCLSCLLYCIVQLEQNGKAF